MRQITREELKKVLELHKMWLNSIEGGSRADLQCADLRHTNLQQANLHSVNLDFSCWPMWCGSLGVKVCKKIAAQILYHFCRLDCDDPDVIAVQKLPQVIAMANQSHRSDECGKLGQ